MSKKSKAASSSRKKVPKKKTNSRHPIHRVGFTAIAFGILFTIGWSAWAVIHTGTIKGMYSSSLRAAPPELTDSTKLYTVDGVASSATLLVKFKSTTSKVSADNVHAQNKAKVKRTIPGIGVQETELAGTTVGEAIRSYRSRPEVEYVEPNFVAQRFFTPNDSLYAKQWHLTKVHADAAWDVSQGGYGPVAVIDTGVDGSHPDMNGYVKQGYNFVNNSTDAKDDNGHGTHVAGIISGQTNNGSGIASIGFKGSILPVKVLDKDGSGSYGSVASGIVYATDQGAKIINLSLGGSSYSQTLSDAVNYALKKGVIVVAAAGNNGNSASVYPADLPGVVAVSATASDDSLASFSSYGKSVYIGAPGVNIISTFTSGGYATMSGTSMAAPTVSGLLGLALSRSQVPSSTLLTYLRQSADKVGPYAYDANGWNQYYGYGRINAGKLMSLIQPQTATTTAADTTVSSDESGQNGQTVHGSQINKFSVDVSGFVDSIDPINKKIVIKVQTISSNLKLATGNIIDLNLDSNSIIKDGNTTVSIGLVQVGDKLSGKVLWQDNKLTVVDMKLQTSVKTASPNPHGKKNR